MPTIHSKTDGLVVVYDAANIKTYSGTGNTAYSFNNNNYFISYKKKRDGCRGFYRVR